MGWRIGATGVGGPVSAHGCERALGGPGGRVVILPGTETTAAGYDYEDWDEFLRRLRRPGSPPVIVAFDGCFGAAQGAHYEHVFVQHPGRAPPMLGSRGGIGRGRGRRDRAGTAGSDGGGLREWLDTRSREDVPLDVLRRRLLHQLGSGLDAR